MVENFRGHIYLEKFMQQYDFIRTDIYKIPISESNGWWNSVVLGDRYCRIESLVNEEFLGEGDTGLYRSVWGMKEFLFIINGCMGLKRQRNSDI